MTKSSMSGRTAWHVGEIIFSWVAVLGFLAAPVILVMALIGKASWSTLVITLVVGVVGKWLWRGFRDNGARVTYMATLMARGLNTDEAAQAWADAYQGGPNKLSQLMEAERFQASKTTHPERGNSG